MMEEVRTQGDESPDEQQLESLAKELKSEEDYVYTSCDAILKMTKKIDV